jgi:hypothetical protein
MMGLTAETHWKEELVVSDEEGRSFLFNCGWGVSPPVAYVPSAADWGRCVPSWLQDRRDEVIAVMKTLNHVVDEDTHPDHDR